MLKGLTIFFLSLTYTAFENTIFAQELKSNFGIDSAQQFIKTEMERDLKLRIQTVSEKQKVIDAAKTWISKTIPFRMSLLQNSEEIKSRFAGYRLHDTIALNPTFKPISFSDPANSLQNLTAAKERAFAGELKSIVSSDEMTTYFITNPLRKSEWKDFYEGVDLNERISTDLVNIKKIEDQLKNAQRGFSDTQNFSTGEFMDEVLQMKGVYSEKMLKKIYDSIGLDKMDSLVHIASELSKQKMTETDLLEVINHSFLEYHKPFADTTQLTSLGKGDLTSLSSEFQQPDLTKFILTDSIGQSLPEINGNQIESQYLKTIDSIRSVRMKFEGLSLSENTITENISVSVIKQQPRFWDRLYFDGVLGVLQDGKGTILKVSPSLGYNITNFLSIGLGPSILVSKDSDEWNGKVGVRSFLKGEFWHQRMYIQLEDNVDPVDVNAESISQTNHSFLAGGGCLLPISKTLAINPAIFYRINNKETQFANTSPWVFRIGISSITKKTR